MFQCPSPARLLSLLLTGRVLGSRLGALAMTAYLIEVASGLPFFQGFSAALDTFSDRRVGTLVAFPAAAYVTGAFAEHGWDKRFLSAAAAMTIGSLVILIAGWAWLSQPLGPAAASLKGIAPFPDRRFREDIARGRGVTGWLEAAES